VTRPPALFLCALLLATSLAACGDDGSDKSGSTRETSAPPSGSSGGLVVTEGISTDDLVGCLSDADLPAVHDDAVPLGVEVPVEGIEVTPLDAWDGTQGVQLWVFTDPAAAEENRVYITLSEEDTPTTRVAGNVVVSYYSVPTEGDAQLAALDACLPA
jgi:hypothetical protein